MAKVFLSHCWDDRDVALRLQKALIEKGGHDVFVDTDILSYGSEWGVGLLNALMTADGVVALLTEAALKSPFVLSEVGSALAGRWRDPNKFLIPVFELGAAWGNNVWTCPLLIRGASAENLPAPMHSRHPLVHRR